MLHRNQKWSVTITDATKKFSKFHYLWHDKGKFLINPIAYSQILYKKQQQQKKRQKKNISFKFTQKKTLTGSDCKIFFCAWLLITSSLAAT